jgi:prevent-host-death family protein
LVTKSLVMNNTVTLAEPKANLSALITAAAAGDTITITRHDRPVTHLTGARSRARRKAGDWGWKDRFDPAMLAPMTHEELRDEGWTR